MPTSKFHFSVVGLAIILLGLIQVNIFGGLNDLDAITSAISCRSSSNDTAGGNNDAINSITPGQTVVLLDTDGPGCINHIWMTISGFYNHDTITRDLVIRMHWDNSDVPSVEAPLGDFFALGHGRQYRVDSAPICVGDHTLAFNCYWPMPFYRHARVEVVNTGVRTVRKIFYNLDYELGPIADNRGLFHALYHRDKALPGQDDSDPKVEENYVLLETTGRGQYVGCVLNIDATSEGWWGEGDDIIFIDNKDKPAILGTGSEDYFCNAWGFDRAYSYAYYGVPLLEKLDDGHTLTTAYRWHIADPVRFQEYIKVTIEHIYPKNVTNDYSSVAFWYQDKPITQRPPLPAGPDNLPRFNPPRKNTSGKYYFDGTEFEAQLREKGIPAYGNRPPQGSRYVTRGGYLHLPAISKGCSVVMPVDEDGDYELTVRLWFPEGTPQMQIGLDMNNLKTVNCPEPGKYPSPMSLGQVTSVNGKVTLYLQSDAPIGLDYVSLEKLTTKDSSPDRP